MFLQTVGRVAACLVLVLSGVTPAAADTGCDTRVFAVDAKTGHLAEVQVCPAGTSWPADTSWQLGSVVTVDSGDWRAYSKVFGAYDGAAVVVYAVTANGELWWRRQETPGAALGAPVRAGSGWSHNVVFAARPGYLAAGDFGGPVHLFRHNGNTLTEDGVLFTLLHGPVITALAKDYAVGNWDGMEYRVWREPGSATHDDVWYPSGQLPEGVHDVTGDGTLLYGVDSSGLVLLTQTQFPCRAANRTDWRPSSGVAGQYSRLIAPVGGDAAPSVASPPPGDPRLVRICGGSIDRPWEWQ
ncbi:hypothetical protein [Actinocrispum sp. NPDC049592]|uniref:hypothetical protein n=1 Tax=Actinocrispum sp. NPDC049592 TaxID=3154835 RepID=UPI00342F6FD9